MSTSRWILGAIAIALLVGLTVRFGAFSARDLPGVVRDSPIEPKVPLAIPGTRSASLPPINLSLSRPESLAPERAVVPPLQVPTGDPIQGRVLTQGEQPLPGVSLRLTVAGARPMQCSSDAEARFFFSLPRETAATLDVTCPGYLDASEYVHAGDHLTIVLEPAVTLSGVITSAATGNPCARASIIASDDSRFQLATTSADGRFTLEQLAAGTVALVVLAEGHLRFSDKVCIPFDPAGLHVALKVAPSVSGQVQDGTTGAPIAGAMVTGTLESGLDASRTPIDRFELSTRTDGAGAFHLAALDLSAATLSVRCEGYLAAKVPGAGLPEPIVIPLTSCHGVHGRVLAPDGDAASQALVALIAHDDAEALSGASLLAQITGMETSTHLEPVRSDDRGDFAFAGVPFFAKFEVVAYHRMWAPATSGILELASAPDCITLRLGKPATVKGKITGLDLPHEIVDVELCSDPPGGLIGRRAPVRVESQADGSFMFGALPPGNFVLRVPHEPRAGQIKFALGEGEVLSVVVPVPAAATISGKCVDTRGAAVAQVDVAASEISDVLVEPWHGTSRTDDDGRFAFDAVPADTLMRLRARGSELLVAAGTRDIALVLKETRSIGGQVRATTNHEPVRGVQVALRPESHAAEIEMREQGMFAIRYLEPGTYELAFSASGFRDVLRVVPVRIDEASGPIDIVMEPTIAVSGNVQDGSGQPLQRVPVWLIGTEGDTQMCWTNVHGEFTFLQLEPGGFELRIGDPDQPALPADRLIVGEQPVVRRYVLPRLGSIEATVLEPSGSPAHAHVELRRSLTFGDTEAASQYSEGTDASGHITFDSLVAGDYQVVVECKGCRTRQLDVSVRPGEIRRETVVLETD